MKIPEKSYLLLILATIALVFILLWRGTVPMDLESYENLRIDQINRLSQILDVEVETADNDPDFVFSDYFEIGEAGYVYLGGISGVPWEVGRAYGKEEVSTDAAKSREDTSYIGFGWGEDNYYINVDRVNASSVREFLQTLDGLGVSAMDSLIVDLRFLRSFDWGEVLRLFNQIAPSRKLVLGTISNQFQEEQILSSGRPFFTTHRTVFLVDAMTPDPVLQLAWNLCQNPDFSLYGPLGNLSDSACLKTTFEIGARKFRVCTAKWTSPVAPPTDQYPGLPDSIRIGDMKNIDAAWYKQQDRYAVKKVILELLAGL